MPIANAGSKSGVLKKVPSIILACALQVTVKGV